MSVTSTGNYTAALFSYSIGMIKNLTIESGEINSTNTGAASLVARNSGIVLSCLNKASITNTGNYAAGLVAYNSGGCVVNSVNMGSVNTSAASGLNYAGGVVGTMTTSGSTVINCYNMGAVTSGRNAGGVAGNVGGGCTVADSYNAGSVQGGDISYNVGGVIGNLTASNLLTCTISNNLFLKTDELNTGLNGIGTSGVSSDQITAGNADSIKASATTLGELYTADTESINNGYPILTWQKTGVYPPEETKEGLAVSSVDTLTNGSVSVTLNKSLLYTRLQTSDFSATVQLGEDAPESLTFTGMTQAGAKATFTFEAITQGASDLTVTVAVGVGSGEKQSKTFNMTASADWMMYAAQPAEGSGTEESPYKITSAAELAWFALQVNSSTNRAACAELENDIILNNSTGWRSWNTDTTGLKFWTPIGKIDMYNASYTGTFDGRGHTISGMYIDYTEGYDSDASYMGLFGRISGAVIKNLGVMDSYIYSNGYHMGAIVGTAAGTTIQNCFTNAVLELNPEIQGDVGGIAGYISGGSNILGCYSIATVQGNGGNQTYDAAGGIAGAASQDTNHFTNCYNFGTVTSASRAGGISGKADYTYAENCYNAGRVSGVGANVGSIFGTANDLSDYVTNCYYLESQAADMNASPKSRAAFTDGTVTSLLGIAFEDRAGVNHGFPVLKVFGEDTLSSPSTPTLKAGISPIEYTSVDTGQDYQVNLADIFDGATAYYASVDGGANETASVNYSLPVSGQTLITFTAENVNGTGDVYCVRINCALKDAADAADALNPTDYWTSGDRWNGTATSANGFWADFQSALSMAHAYLTRANTTSAQLESSQTALTAAQGKLIPKTKVNATALYEVIIITPENTSSYSNYLDSWKAGYQAARDAAATLYNGGAIANEDYTAELQSQIEQAATLLSKIYSYRWYKGNSSIPITSDTWTAHILPDALAAQSRIKGLLQNISKLDEADYTAASWAQLSALLPEANRLAYLSVSSFNNSTSFDSVMEAENIVAMQDTLANAYMYGLADADGIVTLKLRIEGYTNSRGTLYDKEITVDLNNVDTLLSKYFSASDISAYGAAYKTKPTLLLALMTMWEDEGYTSYPFSDTRIRLMRDLAIAPHPLIGINNNHLANMLYYDAFTEDGLFLADTKASMSLHDGVELAYNCFIPPVWSYYVNPLGTNLDAFRDDIYYLRYTQNGVPVSTMEAVEGEDFTLTVEGTKAFYTGSSFGPAANLSVFTSAAYPTAAEAENASNQVADVTTDSQGKVTFQFSAAGYYLITMRDQRTRQYYSDMFQLSAEGTPGGYSGAGVLDINIPSSLIVHVTPMSADDLAPKKAEYRQKVLDAFGQYKEYDFTTENWTSWNNIKTTQLEALDNADSFGAVYTAYATAVSQFNAVPKLNHEYRVRNAKTRMASVLPQDVGELTQADYSAMNQIFGSSGLLTSYEQDNLLTQKERTRYLALYAKWLEYGGVQANFPVAKTATVTISNTMAAEMGQSYNYYFPLSGYTYYPSLDGMSSSISGQLYYQNPISATINLPNTVVLRTSANSSYWTALTDTGRYWLAGSVNGGEYRLLSQNGSNVEFTTSIGADQVGQTVNISLKFITKAEYDAATPGSSDEQALAAAKTAATAAVSQMFASYSQNDYTTDNYNALTSAKTDGLAAIEAASDTAAVTLAQQNALAAMAAIEKLGRVRVVVENTTYSRAQGAPWDGTLLDTYINLSDLPQNPTMMNAILKALDSAQYTYSGTGNPMTYIEGINGLSEFDGGQESGWMGLRNDWMVNEGFAAKTVQAGDVVHVKYTCSYGDDLDASFDNNSTLLKTLSVEGGVLSPSFEGATTSYTLALSENSYTVKLNYRAENLNFQARAYLNNYIVAQPGYLSGSTLSVKNGDVLYIGVGETVWGSMNTGYAPIKYTITVVDNIGYLETLITQLPAVYLLTYQDKAAVDTAAGLYNALSDDIKQSVEGAAKMEEAIARMAVLSTVGPVQQSMAELPSVEDLTYSDVARVMAAAQNYGSLTEEQREELPLGLVERLQEDTTRALVIAAVVDKINAIGTVTLESADAIAEARADYDALTPEIKALIVNYSVLTAAEAQLANLMVEQVAAGITEIAAPAKDATQLTLPDVPEGYTIEIKTSSNTGVIRTDGTVVPPQEATTVNLVLTVTRSSDNSTADTGSIPVLVLARTPTAAEVAGVISYITTPDKDATGITLPTIPEGFSIKIKTSSDTDVIGTDGTIVPPRSATTVNLVLTVTRASDDSTADTASIAVTVPARTPTAADIAGDIAGIDNPVKDAVQLTLPTVPAGYSVAIKSSSKPNVIALNGTIATPPEDTIITLVLTVSKGAVSADTQEFTVTVPKGSPLATPVIQEAAKYANWFGSHQTVSATAGQGTLMMKMEDGDWTAGSSYTTTAAKEETTVSFKAVNAAGNESAVASVTVKVNTQLPSLTVSKDPSGPTNGNVTLTVSADFKDAQPADKAYSFNGGATWQAGNTLAVTDNRTFAVGSIRVKNDLGNIGVNDTAAVVSNIDRTAPTAAAKPASGSRIAYKGTEIAISFNEAVQASGDISVQATGGAVSNVSLSGQTLKFSFDADAYNTKYTFTVSGITDLAGNAYSGTFSYTTVAAPEITKPVTEEPQVKVTKPVAVVSNKTTFTNEQGDPVDPGDVQLAIEEVPTEMLQNAEEQLTDAPEGSMILLQEIRLTDKEGNPLTAGGPVTIILPYPQGTDKNSHSFTVYHFKNGTDNPPEILTGVPTEAGIEITVDGFSVFGLVATASAGTDYCTVILTNTAGGRILPEHPAGALYPAVGTDLTLTFQPDSGYYLRYIEVDGVQTEVHGNTYTFENINQNHTLNAVFAAGSGRTGDDFPIGLYIALMAAAAGAVILLAVKRRKMKKE